MVHHQSRRPQWPRPHPPISVGQARWRAEPLPDALDLLPGMTFYFPPQQMRRLHAAYTRARKGNPRAYPTFQHFVLARVSQGLAERCISLALGTASQSPQTAGAFLATQLQQAARQLGIDQQTLLYGLVVPEDARREQRWRSMRALCARSVSARWGRRGCTSSLVGLGALGLLLCALLSVVEAIAALLVHHPH